MLNKLSSAFLPESTKKRIKGYFGLPLTRLNEDWSILRPIGPILEEHTVLDIGAHNGWFFHCWQDWCPQAQIHAFEPYPESFQTAQRLYGHDPRVRLNQVGVGEAPGELAFNVLGDSKVSNSFLPPQSDTWEKVGYETGEVSQITVPVATVDQYASVNHIDNIYLIKIDVQGYEMHVLRGAEETLEKAQYILVEAGIQRLYEGAPRFSDVFEYLSDRGFHLMSLRAWHRGNRVLMETDMLFRRNDLAPPVDDNVIKTMEHVG